MAILDEDLNKDLAAIAEYFNDTEAVTSKAKSVKDNFANWYNNLSWYAKTINGDDTLNQARNYRKQFNTANAVTAAEKAAAQRVEGGGITSEQAQGKTTQAKLSSGLYAAPDPEPPLIPAEYKVFAVIAGVGVLLIAAYGISVSAPMAFAGYAASRHRDRTRGYF